MAYDEGLAERIRGVLEDRGRVSEKRMFGGLAFLMRGHMTVGIVKDELMVRVGPDTYAQALREPHTRAMDFTGRPMKGFVFVAPPGLESDADLERWVERGVGYAAALPPRNHRPRTCGRRSGGSGQGPPEPGRAAHAAERRGAPVRVSRP